MRINLDQLARLLIVMPICNDMERVVIDNTSVSVV